MACFNQIKLVIPIKINLSTKINKIIIVYNYEILLSSSRREIKKSSKQVRKKNLCM